MSKPKFASLTAGLLARKGEAAPASHGFAVMHGLARTPETAPQSLASEGLASEGFVPESLKRNFVQERRDCLEALPSDEPLPADASPTRDGYHIITHDPHGQGAHTVAVHLPHYHPMGGRRRTAVTVRLDQTRYLRLKLTGARLHRTNQDLLTAALDSYLALLGVEDIEAADLPSND